MTNCMEEGVIPGKGVWAPRKTSNCLDTYADQKLYPSDSAKFRRRMLAFCRFDANTAGSLLLGNSQLLGFNDGVVALSAKGMVFRILAGQPEKLGLVAALFKTVGEARDENDSAKRGALAEAKGEMRTNFGPPPISANVRCRSIGPLF